MVPGTAAQGERSVTVVRGFSGDAFATLTARPEDKVVDLKAAVALLTGTRPRCQQLVHRGAVLFDEDTLECAGLRGEGGADIVVLVVRDGCDVWTREELRQELNG